MGGCGRCGGGFMDSGFRCTCDDSSVDSRDDSIYERECYDSDDCCYYVEDRYPLYNDQDDNCIKRFKGLW